MFVSWISPLGQRFAEGDPRPPGCTAVYSSDDPRSVNASGSDRVRVIDLGGAIRDVLASTVLPGWTVLAKLEP